MGACVPLKVYPQKAKEMTGVDFFEVFFAHLELFLSGMFIACLVLYCVVRKCTIAAYLDPLHFYLTFTFGTAYGVVGGLYVLNYVADFLFFWILSSGLVFLLFYWLFNRLKWAGGAGVFRTLLVPEGDGKPEFLIVLILYICLLATIIHFVGFGLFADTNRFEQNRGFGIFVRVADAFRLFIVAYLSIMMVKSYKQNGIVIFNLLLLTVLVMAIVVSSALNGSKFALLEALYACFVGVSVYWGKPKFRVVHVLTVGAIALFFALFALTVNLQNNEVDTGADAQYVTGAPIVVERLIFRVLGNADKYYLGLPNEVVDKIQTDNAAVRFLSPLIGVTRLSDILGYNVNDFNVGRQLLLYFDPAREVAGGPTSHFDLFSYKYFGIFFGLIWIVFTAFLLAAIRMLARAPIPSIFYASLVSALWLRGLPILLEPPVGFAYIVDIFVLFFVIKVVGILLPRRGNRQEKV